MENSLFIYRPITNMIILTGRDLNDSHKIIICPKLSLGQAGNK